jgi:hypothetical protein
MPAPALPSRRSANEVASEEAERFTILLPIKIVLSNLPGWSINFNTSAARLLPSSDKARILCLLTVVKAVSAEEKNPDKINKIIKNIN